MSTTRNKSSLFILFLTFLCFAVSPLSSMAQVPDSVSIQLDQVEGRARLEVWKKWIVSYKTKFAPYPFLKAIPLISEEASTILPQDSALLFQFDIYFHMVDNIRKSLYLKESTQLFDLSKDLADQLEVLGPKYIKPIIQWYITYAYFIKEYSGNKTAIEYYEKAVKLLEVVEDNNLAIKLYQYMALAYRSLDGKTLHKSLECFEKAEAYLSKMEKPPFQKKVQLAWKKALILEQMGRMEEAKETFDIHLDSISKYLYETNYLSDYGDLLSNMGQEKEALALLEEINKKVPYGGPLYKRTYFIEEYIYVLAMAGDVEKSIALSKEYKDLVRQDIGDGNNTSVLSWHAKYENDRKEAELKRLMLENKVTQAAFNRNIALIFSLLMIGVAALFFNLYRNKNKREQLALEVETGQAITQNRDRLFSSITHDIRTPLALMLAPLERAQGKSKNPETVADLQRARKNGTQLMKIFTQVLDWNKAEAKALSINPQIGNLDITLDSLCANFEKEAIENSLLLKTNIAVTNDQYKLDYDKLEKILTYTLDNAFRYCRPGDQITLNAQIQNQSALILSISDTGPNIQETEIDNIKEEEGKDENKRGVGIGLALVKNIVHIMKGEIQFHATKPEGTVFDIKIPIEYISHNYEEEKSTFVDYSGGHLPSILIVEDEPELLEFIASTLDGRYKVEKASSAIIGLNIAESQLPDIIITDWNLPDQNGGWLCKKIKNNEVLAHIPIMVLTANNNDENKRTAFEAGAVAWMSKPFRIKSLQNQLSTILQQQQKSKEYWKNVQLTKEIANQKAKENLDPFIEKVFENIKSNFHDKNFAVDQLAENLSINRVQLHRKTTKLIGQTPSSLIKIFRMEKAQSLIKEAEMTIAEVAYAVGFSEPNYFGTVYKKHFGINPSEENKN